MTNGKIQQNGQAHHFLCIQGKKFTRRVIQLKDTRPSFFVFLALLYPLKGYKASCVPSLEGIKTG